MGGAEVAGLPISALLSADIIGYGRLNDFGKPVTVNAPTSIVFRKDSLPFGVVSVNVYTENAGGNDETGEHTSHRWLEGFTLEVNGKPQTVRCDGALNVVEGDIVRIIDTKPSVKGMPDTRIDFFGFVPRNARKNAGSDAGYPIDTSRDLMPYYSSYAKGSEYRIQLYRNGAEMAQMRLKVIQPEIDFLVLHSDNGMITFLKEGDVCTLPENTTAVVHSVTTNIPRNAGVSVRITGIDEDGNTGAIGKPFNVSSDLLSEYSVDQEGALYPVIITYRDRQIGVVYIQRSGANTGREEP